MIERVIQRIHFLTWIIFNGKLNKYEKYNVFPVTSLSFTSTIRTANVQKMTEEQEKLDTKSNSSSLSDKISSSSRENSDDHISIQTQACQSQTIQAQVLCIHQMKTCVYQLEIEPLRK